MLFYREDDNSYHRATGRFNMTQNDAIAASKHMNSLSILTTEEQPNHPPLRYFVAHVSELKLFGIKGQMRHDVEEMI